MSCKIKKKEKYHPHVKSTVDFFKKTFPPPLNVLDVGTRDGYAVELLNKYGYDALGIDIVPEYIAYAQKRTRNVRYGNIMNEFHIQMVVYPGMFDIIFSRHCIEHCDNTLKFLNNCANLLKPEGHVFFTFPLETEEQFNKRDDDEHKVYFEHKEDFRKIKSKFKEVFFGKSKSVGIKTEGKERLFIGKL